MSFINLARPTTTLLTLLLLTTSLAAQPAEKSDNKPVLFIGDKAPALSIEHWVGNQKNQIADFKRGTVYIVGFWGTECDPCIAAMEHLAKLQKKHPKSVQIANVTDDNLARVKWFLDQPVSMPIQSDAKDHKELIDGLAVGVDPDSSTNDAYLQAAGQSGIPTSFLIGKDGTIQWIGHPMVIDDPLTKVLDGSWDPKAYVKEYRERRLVTETMMSVTRKMRSGQVDEAVLALDKYLDNGTIEAEKDRFRTMKLRVLASSRAHADAAAKYALNLLKRKDLDAQKANDLAWTIYKMAENGDFEDQDVLVAALELTSEKSRNAGDLKPYILDTVAHLQHFTGDHVEAYKTQRRAYRLAKDSDKKEFKEYLDELEKMQK